MSKRLPEGKRVRTVTLGHVLEAVVTEVPTDKTLVTEVFQDDVTIIGALLATEWLITDAMANADGDLNSYVILTRAATRAQKTSDILMCNTQKVWTAAIVIGNGDNRKEVTIMFPEGMGIEVDEGEAINILAFLEWTGAGGNSAFYANAILYYVER